LNVECGGWNYQDREGGSVLSVHCRVQLEGRGWEDMQECEQSELLQCEHIAV